MSFFSFLWPYYRLLRKALRLILQENSFQFNKRNYWQTHRTAMGTKMAVAFACIFMGEIEKQILNESAHKTLAWKHYIDEVISLWHTSREVVEKFIEQANKHHPTIKFTAEVSCTDATSIKHHNIPGPKIQHGVSSRYEDALQTNGDIPVHVLYNVSPTGSKERLCQRRSSKTP